MEDNRKTAQVTRLQIGIAAALAGGAVLVNYYPQAIFFILVAGAAAWVTWTAAEKKREAREAAARLAGYVNICAPQIISSHAPKESVSELMQRAEQFREDLRLSGNPYWSEIPVIPYPYEPMLFGVGQLTAAWDIYKRMVGERQHIENLAWVEKCPTQLRPLFLSQVMPQPATTQTETV